MRWRLIAVLVGFTALVLLVQNIPLTFYMRSVERDRLVTLLQRDAFTLAGASVEVLEEESPNPKADKALAATVKAYSATNGSRVVIVNDKSLVVAGSEDAVGESFVRPEIDAALDGQAVSGDRPSVTLGEPLMYVAVPVRAGTSILGAVRITYPTRAVDDAVNDRVRGIGLAALITLITSLVIAIVVANAVTRRIRRLRDAAEQIAEGDLTARADVQGSDEIHELGESFNTMAERVQAVVESQRGFAGDASHQLRTPLTALRLRLDRAAELMDDDDPAVGQVDAARDEIDRLQRLVDGLLVLARADGRDHETTPVDIAAIAADRVEAWAPLAAERGITIELHANGVAVAHVVESAPEQIIDNYLDNALEAVPDGSLIVVSVRTEPGGVVVTIDDSGPGLPAEHREHAFDRFWRGSQDGTGSGLGLAVVASLAHASGGAVWLAESPQGGLRAAARFIR